MSEEAKQVLDYWKAIVVPSKAGSRVDSKGRSSIDVCLDRESETVLAKEDIRTVIAYVESLEAKLGKAMMKHSFGWALEQMEAGKRVARAGWNGKGLWLVLVSEWAIPSTAADGPAGCLHTMHKLPFIAMKTVHDSLVPWLASQTDMLGTDWEEVVG